MKSSGKCSLRAQRSCVLKIVNVVRHDEADLEMYKNHPDGTGFAGMKGSWRAAEACHYESPGKTNGESAASHAVDSPGLKRSKLRLRTMKRTYERLLVKPSCSKRFQKIGGANTVGDHQEHQQQWRGVNQSLEC